MMCACGSVAIVTFIYAVGLVVVPWCAWETLLRLGLHVPWRHLDFRYAPEIGRCPAVWCRWRKLDGPGQKVLLVLSI